MDISAPVRVILIVIDSVGIGELPDARDYGDTGSDTLGNIARQIPLAVPNLRVLGLARVAAINRITPEPDPAGAFGRMAEASPGKDSVTGHWELMGLVLERPFPVFPNGFPSELIDEFERRIGRKTLANKAASGTAIIEELGAEHMRTGKPIVYTSADSVFQIAAHEDVVPVEELYRWCEIAYELAGIGMGVGRVIARPFIGAPGAFRRTANRRDFALRPARSDAARPPDGGRPPCRRHRQDRGSLRRPGHHVRDPYGQRRAGHGRSAARDDHDAAGAHLREPRRLRHACTGTATTSPGTRPISSGSTRASGRCVPRLGRRRSAGRDGRSWQRSDDAEHRPRA